MFLYIKKCVQAVFYLLTASEKICIIIIILPARQVNFFHALISNFSRCILLFFYLKQSSDISFKIGLSSSKKSCVICFIENLLKMMKNVFYFILKAHFVRKIYLFYQVFFSQVLFMTFWSGRKNSLIGKIRLTSKLMTSQPG